MTTDMARLIEPVIPALRRYARALTRDPTEADDLVQDCLERAVGRWSQRRPDADARTWMFSILHNLAVSRHRQVRRRGPHFEMDEADATAFALAPTQEHSVRHGELLRALDALPADQRGLLLLIGVEGLSYAEAAQALGVPVGTVMSRLSRARDKLAHAMDAGARRPALRRVK